MVKMASEALSPALHCPVLSWAVVGCSQPATCRGEESHSVKLQGVTCQSTERGEGWDRVKEGGREREREKKQRTSAREQNKKSTIDRERNKELVERETKQERRRFEIWGRKRKTTLP